MWEKRNPTSCSWWLTGNWPPRYFGQRTIIWTESDIQSSEKRNFCSQAVKSLKHASTWNPISRPTWPSCLPFWFRMTAYERGGDLCKVRRLKGPAMGSIARLWGVYRDPTDCITMRHKAASTATTRESSTLPLHQGQCHAKHQGHQENVQIKCICLL